MFQNLLRKLKIFIFRVSTKSWVILPRWIMNASQQIFLEFLFKNCPEEKQKLRTRFEKITWLSNFLVLTQPVLVPLSLKWTFIPIFKQTSASQVNNAVLWATTRNLTFGIGQNENKVDSKVASLSWLKIEF